VSITDINYWCSLHGWLWIQDQQDREAYELIFPGKITSKQVAALRDLPPGIRVTLRSNIESPGVAMVADERQRQISDEGYTPEHDDRHDREELARAAAAYAVPTHPWPWHSDGDRRSRHAGDRLRQLAIAGALIAAEIDRLLRLKADGGGA